MRRSEPNATFKTISCRVCRLLGLMEGLSNLRVITNWNSVVKATTTNEWAFPGKWFTELMKTHSVFTELMKTHGQPNEKALQWQLFKPNKANRGPQSNWVRKFCQHAAWPLDAQTKILASGNPLTLEWHLPESQVSPSIPPFFLLPPLHHSDTTLSLLSVLSLASTVLQC